MFIVHCLFVCVCQFSGQLAEEMLKTYSEFCSRHIKAVKLYKELLARDKRLQLFVRVRTRMTNEDVCPCALCVCITGSGVVSCVLSGRIEWY